MNNPLRKPFKYTFFSASLILILLNFLIFFLTQSFPKVKIYCSICPDLFFRGHMYWQIFTYMFIHGNFMHIFSNMIGLFFFGMTVEKALGSKEFLLLYFICGIMSGLLSLLYYYLKGTYSVFLMGASGALFAIMFAYAVIFPRAKLYIWGLLPIPSPLLVILYAAIEVFSQLAGYKSNIAHYAHLFGFLCAFLYFQIRMGINPFKIWKNAYLK